MTSVCRKSIGLRPMFLAMSGLLAMLLGRLVFDSTPVMGVGIVMLLIAAFWTARSACQKACATASAK
jgi:hypothetical protein